MEERNHNRKGAQSTPGPAEPLISKHGGYRSLRSFQIAQLVYDLTVRFCDLYVGQQSRTHTQMVQAARSGVQNIAEGSQVSGTSKKMELKLTNVARASLEEQRLDYEDYLRQHGLAVWPPDHPAMRRFRAQRCAALDDVRHWVQEELQLAATDHSQNAPSQTRLDSSQSVSAGVSTGASIPPSVLAANAALSLLNLCCYFLDRQIAAQAAAFENEGGFTERLYRVRQNKRRRE